MPGAALRARETLRDMRLRVVRCRDEAVAIVAALTGWMAPAS